MLSLSARGNAAQAADYYLHLRDEHGRPDEYYSREGAGQWFGAGAAALGLAGDVSPDDFALAAEGRSPAGQDQVQGAGPAHRAGWDLTFSCPKSVSVLWGVADSERRAAIQRAHNQAIERALANIESEFSLARRGKAGAERERASLLFSVFQHGTSREQDPQLHSHAFLHNLARRQDGSWGGIDPKQVFQWKMALGAVYRAELASAMADLGYQIKADGDSFKVAGVPDGVCHEFSKRREQIEQALAAAGQSSAKAAELAALGTRAAKSRDLDPAALHACWTQQAADMGFTADQVLALSAEAQAEPMPTPAELLDKATSHDAVVEERHIWQCVAIAAQHRGLGLDSIKEHVQAVLDSPEIMRVTSRETGETRYTTKALYRQEREIIGLVEARAGETAHAVSTDKVTAALGHFAHDKGFSLSDEQQNAVRHVTEREGAVQTVVGDAGTGKSTMLAAANIAWKENGQRVIGAAISGKAAAGLQEGSGIESNTLASLLMALEPSVDIDTGEVRQARERLTERDVLVVDEAGMVDSRTMHRLTEHVNRAGARLVLVGDHKQLQAVGAGGVFRYLAERDSAQITEIRRQRENWAREAVEQFSRGEAAEAITKFLDRDLVHIADDQRTAITQAVDRWVDHAAAVGVSETLLMASTNAEVHELNQAARARMQADHHLVNEIQIQTCDRNGRPAGKLQIAEGDRILCKKNDRTTGLKNGDLASVTRIEYRPDGVRLHVALDRTGEPVSIDPQRYSQLRHGYAVTVHAAQGATVDRAVVLAGGSMTSRESTYVQMSRMRDTAELITTRQQLRNAAEVLAPTDRMRDLAATVAAEQQIELPPECSDSFAECRSWLNQNSHTTLPADRADDQLSELRDLVEAMSTSHQKETTLDYQEAEPPAQDQPAREQQAAQIDQAAQEQEHDYDEMIMTMSADY